MSSYSQFVVLHRDWRYVAVVVAGLLVTLPAGLGLARVAARRLGIRATGRAGYRRQIPYILGVYVPLVVGWHVAFYCWARRRP